MQTSEGSREMSMEEVNKETKRWSNRTRILEIYNRVEKEGKC